MGLVHARPDSTAGAPAAAPFLHASTVSRGSGGITALDGISFNVARGQIAGLDRAPRIDLDPLDRNLASRAAARFEV
jgi:hypothetical protein